MYTLGDGNLLNGFGEGGTMAGINGNTGITDAINKGKGIADIDCVAALSGATAERVVGSDSFGAYTSGATLVSMQEGIGIGANDGKTKMDGVAGLGFNR